MTNLVRRRDWDLVPGYDRDQFFAPFEQIFDQFFTDFWKAPVLDKLKASSGMPRMDIGTEGDYFVIRANVAGVDPDNVKVEMTPEGTVRISGHAEKLPEEGNYAVREISRRQFVREVALPEALRSANFNNCVNPEATIKNGELTLKWPLPKEVKSQVAARPISIKRE